MSREPMNDGSVEAALAHFPADFASDTYGPDSADDQANSALADPVAPPIVEPEKAKEEPVKADPAKAKAADEDDDDWVEFPAAEEGKDPERYKLQDIWHGYQEAKTLKTELEIARKSQTMPAEMQAEVEKTIVERGRYAQVLQTWQAQNQPVVPDIELLNQASMKYDPDAYYKAVQDYQVTMTNQRTVRAEMERVQDLQMEQSEALRDAHFARERSKLIELWPEMKDGSVAEGVRTTLETTYGIDRKTLSEVLDSRFYAVAKDALAYRAQQAKQAEAVKVVRAKPRLIPGGARPNANGLQQRSSERIASLRKSGSLDDAADAFDAFSSFN